ncbi:MAG: HIT family protein [Clostridiales bacterium]|nr:HIT family protein [Clostridiales bacterium]
MSECYYCGDEYKKYMKPIAELSVSYAYMAGYQKYYPGRCIVCLKRHAEEWFELTDEELCGFSRDIATVARAIEAAFPCDKLNYGICGDGNRHLHMHIVPKLKDGYTWGKLFEMLPPVEDQILIPDAQLDAMIERIRAHL